MLTINEIGKIYDPERGDLTSEHVSEKEILISIAAKLHSIRGMLRFFVGLTIVSALLFIISLVVSR